MKTHISLLKTVALILLLLLISADLNSQVLSVSKKSQVRTVKEDHVAIARQSIPLKSSKEKLANNNLPFLEDWQQGSFSYNGWLFLPSQGNWIVDPASGNPAPCASFTGMPVVTNYSYSLLSPVLNAIPYTCADFWLDFDIKLFDNFSTGTEKLDVDLYYNNNWVNLIEYSNTGSTDWLHQRLAIDSVRGKPFQIRFRAYGVSSSGIQAWYIDNIHAYADCRGANNVNAHTPSSVPPTTYLVWTTPDCGPVEPTPQWITWCDGTNTNSIGTGGAVDFWIAGHWDASQIVALDGGSITKINFWPASAGTATYRARVWVGPLPTVAVVDQAIPTVVNDQWNTVTLATPSVIDVSQELWIGIDVNTTGGYPAGVDAGPAVDGYGDMIYWSGAWATLPSLNPSLDYNWDIEAYVEPSKKKAGTSAPIHVNIPNNSKGQTLSVSGTRNTSKNTSSNHGSGRINPESSMGSQLLGYNIFRTPDDETSPFLQVNTSLINELNYTDVHTDTYIPYPWWYYYIVTVYGDSASPGIPICEGISDTIFNMQAEGIPGLKTGKITIFPNPAAGVVNLNSDEVIDKAVLYDCLGNEIPIACTNNDKAKIFDISACRNGLYFLKITTAKGTHTTKLTIIH